MRFCFVLKAGCAGVYHRCREDGLPACGTRVDTCALEHDKSPEGLGYRPCRRCFPEERDG